MRRLGDGDKLYLMDSGCGERRKLKDGEVFLSWKGSFFWVKLPLFLSVYISNMRHPHQIDLNNTNKVSILTERQQQAFHFEVLLFCMLLQRRGNLVSFCIIKYQLFSTHPILLP